MQDHVLLRALSYHGESHVMLDSHSAFQSPKCQKENWPAHKEQCKTNTKLRKQMAEADRLTAMLRMLTGDQSNLPPSSLVHDELGEFLKRFRAMICRAGYCCLKIKQNPDAWSKYIFQLRIERIPNPPQETKPWERYKVVSGEQLSVAELLEKGDDFRTMLPQTERYRQRNADVGCVGTLTTFLVCDSSGQDIRCVSWGGFGKDSWNDVTPGEDWFETIRSEVERLSGRAR